jgi:hypothetical protein
MKKIIFIGVMILSSSMLFAQDRDHDRDNRDNKDRRNQRQAPNSVQESWRRDHPDVSNPTWEQRNGQWHARYQDQRNNNRNTEVYYDQRGRQIDSHTAWDRNQMPKDFDKRMRSRYHARDYQVTRIDRPNNQGSLFQILLNLGSTKRTIYTDENGREVRYRDRH